MILRHIVDDIIKDLKQNFDDAQIIKSQVAFWVLLIGNRLKSQHIQKKPTGAFLSTFGDVPVQTAEATSKNTIKGRKYIELPGVIYDFKDDHGIAYICYYDEDVSDCDTGEGGFLARTFHRTTVSGIQRLYDSVREKPSSSNPYFYRVNDKVYLLGIDDVDVESVEIGLYMALDPVTKIDIDAEFDFPEDLVYILTRQVLDLGRFVLMVPQERINDGSNIVNPNSVPGEKLVSVNDSVNRTDAERTE